MSMEIRLPKLNETMEEGTIILWRVRPGDLVECGDVLVEIETDREPMELVASAEGTVAEVRVAEGKKVPVGSILAVLSSGTAASPAAVESDQAVVHHPGKVDAGSKAQGQAEVHDEDAGDFRSSQAAASGSPVPRGGQARHAAVSTAARRLAQKHEIPLAQLRGSGPGGRVVSADVEQLLQKKSVLKSRKKLPEDAAQCGGKAVKIHRIMARKMTESWQTIPHFYVTFAVDMTDIIRFRKDLKLTINDFILAGVTRSLKEHPWVNSWWVDGEAVEQPQIDIAIAIATDRGLFYPVIRNCGQLSLRQISRKAAECGRKAHSGKLTAEDMEGGTFTTSNMGMLGVESFRAIITPPQAAVLAVGTVRGEVIVDDQGEPAVAPVMRMTLTADHRILDGADAAEFMATLKSYLEAPVTLISPE